MGDIRFSVVVCSLNSALTLNKSLESVYSQIYPPSEVILVDGYSTDSSIDIFNSFRRECDRLITAPRSGPYAAMNIGIHHARYDIIAILNSDDYWSSTDVLQDVASIYSANDERLAIVHGDIQVMTQAGENKGIIKPSTSCERYCGLGLPFCHPATFIRRETYLIYGNYNWIAFPCQADRDLGFRLDRYKATSVYIPRVLTVFSTGGLSCITYDKHETLKIINTLPPIRRLIGQGLGLITSLHPKYYSGHVRLSIIRLVKELLGDLLRRFINFVVKS
jgi:glycosyltransferase involved in cell wall biosynthesis